MTTLLSNNITEILKEKEVSQQELAELTGISKSAISRYINAQRVPSSENLFKIASALDVMPDEILKMNRDTEKQQDLRKIILLIKKHSTSLTLKDKMEIMKALVID